MPHAARFLLMLVAAVLAAGVALVVRRSPREATPPVGATPALPPEPEGPFPEPVLVGPGVISTGDDESHPTFTPDGGTLYFLKNAPAFNHWTIVTSRLEGGRWVTPEVAPFSGRFGDADVSFTAGGDTMFFISTRPLTPGAPPRRDTEIWRMVRTDGGWGEPEHLAELGSPLAEWFPTVAANGTIYFGSERGEGNHGPAGTSDLWRARLVDGRYAAPENLGPVINTPGEDIEGWIAPDESFLLLASKGRPDTRGSYDLYVSFQRDGRWTEPRNLGDAVNTAGWEFGAKLTPDGRRLLYTSTRGRFDRPLDRRLEYGELLSAIRGPGNGLRDIWQVDAAALDLTPP